MTETNWLKLWREAVDQRQRAEGKTRDEERARAEAQRYARAAEDKTHEEARARAEAQRFSTRLLLERGLALCQQAEYDRGLLWLARGLELAPDEAPKFHALVVADRAAAGT